MPAQCWESINVDDWLREADSRSEPLGGKEKFWITGPDGHEYLFKFARCDPDGSNVRGEDWAEWAVHQLAELIGVPTAVAIPGTVGGRRGVLSCAVWHEREQLIHGNELLARMDPAYDAAKTRQNPGYSIDAVHAALTDVAAPPSSEPPINSGFDAWAGHLVLDAWVAGRDRHHENWAVINRSGSLFLAPSFDHGNALGFQESERKMVAMSSDDAHLERRCQRGKSPHFVGQPSLVDVANDALRVAGDAVRAHWRSKLARTSTDELTDVFDRIPDNVMSEHGRRFRVKLLTVNRKGSSMTISPWLHAAVAPAVDVRRRLFLIWQNPDNSKFVRVGVLSELVDGRYAFEYTAGADTAGFHPLVQFSDVHKTYVSDALPAFFVNRLMSKRRPSYPVYLDALGIDMTELDTPMELLARTGGPRASDTFHIVDDFTADGHGCVVTRFLASGVRHVDGSADALSRVRPGDQLQLRADTANPVNKRAQLVCADTGDALGYVPNWLLGDLEELLERAFSYRVIAERVTPDAEPHVRLLCRIEAQVPSDRLPSAQ